MAVRDLFYRQGNGQEIIHRSAVHDRNDRTVDALDATRSPDALGGIGDRIMRVAVVFHQFMGDAARMRKQHAVKAKAGDLGGRHAVFVQPLTQKSTAPTGIACRITFDGFDPRRHWIAGFLNGNVVMIVEASPFFAP